MTGGNAPINLNKARKARAQAEKRARADANAVKFGRSKAERRQDEAARTRASKQLDGHKRDDTGPDGA